MFAFTNSDTALKRTQIHISKNSSLLIKGTSNVNSFKCYYNIKKIGNPIPIQYKFKDENLKFENTLLTLNNSCFDCGGRAINNDFNKILDSNNHPQLFLTLQEINPIKNTTSVEANLAITIAGVTNNYRIPVGIENGINMQVTGDLSLSLNDFNLKSPKKIFGLIKVDDTINIFFKLFINVE
ncbi:MULTISPECIES: YceI family protein [Cellulophaga]|uniref:YceI family protein n=1 Tax=Cellulophaga TaxID=104264 RepID=UPI001C0690DF|nr:YceI family protein [Cellulophaga sp. 1_MG-2023]MDO6768053.1 YceI family protein [Cellulophaga sp. 1_MG-2023]